MKLTEYSNINVIRRGMRYSRENRVLKLKKHSDTQYSGVVKGSKGMIYDVFLDIDNHKKSTCTCPCISICKHILCLLFKADEKSRNNAISKINEYKQKNKKTIRKYYDNKKELIEFLLSIYNGVDPYTGEKIDNENFLNKPDSKSKIYNIILLLRNNTKITKRFREIKFKEFTNYSLDQIVKPTGVYITKFVQEVNEIRISNAKDKITVKKIEKILINEGYLYFNENGIIVPTLKGEKCGMISVFKKVRGKSFYTIEYNMFAQKELISLIEKYF